MWDPSKDQRRTFRDEDPPRIIDNKSNLIIHRDDVNEINELSMKSTSKQPSPLTEPLRRDSEFLDNQKRKTKEREEGEEKEDEEKEKYEIETVKEIKKEWKTENEEDEEKKPDLTAQQDPNILSCGARNEDNQPSTVQQRSEEDGYYCKGRRGSNEDFLKELAAKGSSIKAFREVIGNGVKYDSDNRDGLTNGKSMPPVLGVPPPPPPAPHMGPDGLILPKKLFNPCIAATNHKDLRRELLFNQKVGKNVLNQKSELQRAMEKQRETAARKEAEKLKEENYKDNPRTALQRAIEQRAKQLEEQQMQQPVSEQQSNNVLATARAKLKHRTESP